MKTNNSDLFCRDYHNGQTITEIARNYNISAPTVWYWLKKRGIKIRGKRKYKIIESYFDEIDTKEKAYFLGLLYADGYNYTAGKNKHFSLSLVDTDVLILFKKQLIVNIQFIK